MTKYDILFLIVELAVLIGVWLNTTINLVRLKKPPKD